MSLEDEIYRNMFRSSFGPSTREFTAYEGDPIGELSIYQPQNFGSLSNASTIDTVVPANTQAAQNLFDIYATGFNPDKAALDFWTNKINTMGADAALNEFLNPSQGANAPRYGIMSQDADFLAATGRAPTIQNNVASTGALPGASTVVADTTTTGALPGAVTQTKQDTTTITPTGQDTVTSVVSDATKTADTVSPTGDASTASALTMSQGDKSSETSTSTTLADQAASANKAATTTTTTTKPQDLVYDYQGNAYDKLELLNLASQIAPNVTKLAGGVFSTKGENIGFAYDEAKKVLGGDPTAAQQVVLDMARNMLKMGIKDISQLEVKDVKQDFEAFEIYDDNGRPTGRYAVQIQDPNDPENVITRELTPEEVARLRTESTIGPEGENVRRIAEDVLTGKGLYSGEQLVSMSNEFVQNLALDIGATYTGKDATKYQLIINPTTGKPEFMAYHSSTSDMDKVNAALTLASFVPGVNVFAKAAQAVLAIRNGDTLGGLASLAGAGGYTNVATALSVAKAVDDNNPLGVVTALMNNPEVSKVAGGIKIDGNITLADVGTGLNLAQALANKNWGQALTLAGNLTKSQDLKTAGAATSLIQAIESGNPMAIANATMNLNKVVEAGNKITDTTVATNIANSVKNTQLANVSSTITGTATDAVGDKLDTTMGGTTTDTTKGGVTVSAGDVNTEDTFTGLDQLSVDTYIAAKNAGATDAEALAAANAVITDSTKGVDDFGGFDGAAADTKARTTLTISNTEADSPQEAAALAASKGYTSFTYGGQTYNLTSSSQTITDQVTKANIDAASNVNDAFKIARDALGPGKSFEWNGKTYTTSTDAEIKQQELLKQADLSFSKDLLPVAQNSFLTNAKSNPALFNPQGLSALELMNQFDRFANASPEERAAMLSGPNGQMFTVMSNAIKMNAGVDPVTGLSTKIDPKATTEGSLGQRIEWIVLSGGAQAVSAVVGAANALNLTERGGEADKNAKIMNDLANSAMSENEIKQQKEIQDGFKNAKDWKEVLAVVAKAPIDQPLYTAGMILSEIMQEGATAGIAWTAMKGAQALQLAKTVAAKLGIGTDIALNMIESGGAAAQEAYERTKKDLDAKVASGEMSRAEADRLSQEAAQKNLALASIMTGTIMVLPGGNALTKQILTGDGKTTGSTAASVVSKTTGKEIISEGAEETAIEAGTQFVVDPNAAFDTKSMAFQGGMGMLVTSGTVSTISAIDTALSDTNKSLMSDGATQSDINTIKTQISESLSGNTPIADVRNNVTNYLIEDLGYTQEQAASVTNELINNQTMLNFATTLDQANLSDDQVATVSSSVNDVLNSGDDLSVKLENTTKVLSEAGLSQDEITKINNSLFPGVISDITTTADTTKATDTTKSTTGNVTTTTSTNATTGATTDTSVNNTTGVTTQVTTNPTTNTTTTTKADTTTGVNTQTTTDTNNNTNTTTTTDTNTGTTTQTTVNNNNNTSTTTNSDTNNNTVTQVTTNNNTNTSTSTQINNNTNVTTQVTTDNNNNTETSVVTDPNNNTQTTTTTNTTTGEVTSTVTTDIPDDWEQPVIDPPPPVVTTPPTVTPPPPKTTVTPKKPTSQTAAQALPSLLAAPAVYPDDGPKFKDPFITSKDKQRKFVGSLDPFFQEVESGSMINPEFGVPAPVQLQDQTETKEETMPNYFTYGMQTDLDRLFGPTGTNLSEFDEPMAAAAGGLATPLMAGGGLTRYGRYAGGGLPLVAHSGKTRVDFRQGDAVTGAGDGQSDDIPAMLADGEFVIPADVVAALGNGSTKAGSDKLYDMMHSIRAYHRSAKPKDLPPPAKKNPLDYLKKTSRKARR